MLVKCDQCQAKYNIKIKKHQGKAVKFKCKKCENLIRISPQEIATENGESQPQSAPDTPTGQAKVETVKATCTKCGNSFIKPAPDKSKVCYQCRIDLLVGNIREKYGVSAPPSKPEEEPSRYTIRSSDGLVLGPIKFRTVAVLAREKKILGREDVSKDDSDYKPLLSYPELGELFPGLKELMDTEGLEDKVDEAFMAAFGDELEDEPTAPSEPATEPPPPAAEESAPEEEETTIPEPPPPEPEAAAMPEEDEAGIETDEQEMETPAPPEPELEAGPGEEQLEPAISEEVEVEPEPPAQEPEPVVPESEEPELTSPPDQEEQIQVEEIQVEEIQVEEKTLDEETPPSSPAPEPAETFEEEPPEEPAPEPAQAPVERKAEPEEMAVSESDSGETGEEEPVEPALEPEVDVGTEFDLDGAGEGEEEAEPEEEEEIIEDLEPIIEPSPDTRYRVRYPDGLMLGPIKLATIKELFDVGNMTGQEEVQREDEPWVNFVELPELAELVSETDVIEDDDVIELTEVLD